MITMKPIRPKDFKEKAFTETLAAEARDIGQQIKADYQKTTATWKRKPAFDLTVTVQPRAGIKILVTTKDKVYEYVTKGTRPHIIRAKNAVALRFQSGYRAKTRKGLIGSTSGGASGDVAYAKVVQHPGTEGREFDQAIAKVWKRVLRKRFQDAMKRAAQASGHSMRR